MHFRNSIIAGTTTLVIVAMVAAFLLLRFFLESSEPYVPLLIATCVLSALVSLFRLSLELAKRQVVRDIVTYSERIHQRRINQRLFPVQVYINGRLFEGTVERRVNGRSLLSLHYPALFIPGWGQERRDYEISDTSVLDTFTAAEAADIESGKIEPLTFREVRGLRRSLKAVAEVPLKEQARRARLEGQVR